MAIKIITDLFSFLSRENEARMRKMGSNKRELSKQAKKELAIKMEQASYRLGKIGDILKLSTKNKIILFGSLFLFTFFFSAYLSLMLSNKEINFYNLLPHVIVMDMIENRINFLIFLSISLCLLMCVVLVINMGNREYYKSELDDITDTIKTPKRVGQSQHGSAKWLEESKYENVFSSYEINPFYNERLNDLMEKGAEDRKKVKKIENTNKNTDEGTKQNTDKDKKTS